MENRDGGMMEGWRIEMERWRMEGWRIEVEG